MIFDSSTSNFFSRFVCLASIVSFSSGDLNESGWFSFVSLSVDFLRRFSLFAVDGVLRFVLVRMSVGFGEGVPCISL